MPRTSRTGTLRAASAACASGPLAIGVPLLVAAFLAVLWLLSAAPAQADTHPTGEGPAVSDTTAKGGALGLGETPDLDQVVPEQVVPGRVVPGQVVPGQVVPDKVVPEEVAEPVTTTLGTVHPRLEKGASDTTAAAASLSEQNLPDADLSEANLSGVRGSVRGEVSGVVSEIDRTREATVERGLAHALPNFEPGRTQPSSVEGNELGPGTKPEEAAENAKDSKDREEPDAGTEHSAPAQNSALHPQHRPVPVAATAAPVTTADTEDHAAESHRTQPGTGAPAPTANGPAPTPAVAGYLNVAPLPAPEPDAVRLAAHRLHTVPADPADDLTVSPD